MGVPDLKIVSSRRHLSLGDILQRLAIVAPRDLAAIELLVRDVWHHHRLRRPTPRRRLRRLK